MVFRKDDTWTWFKHENGTYTPVWMLQQGVIIVYEYPRLDPSEKDRERYGLVIHEGDHMWHNDMLHNVEILDDEGIISNVPIAAILDVLEVPNS